MPSYVREWEAFVARACATARTPPVGDGRRARAARHRPGRVALAARGPAGARRRGGGGIRVKVWLTGATGFVGSNLARVFAAHGAELARPARAEVDLTDPARVAAQRREAAPDAIVHARSSTTPRRWPPTGARRGTLTSARRATWSTRANEAGAQSCWSPATGCSTARGAGGRGRAAQPGQPLRLPEGGERAGGRPSGPSAARSRASPASRGCIGRGRGPARAGRRLRLPRRLARRRRCARASRSRVWGGAGDQHAWPRRRWPPTRAS